jgi:hypothetical protein
VQSDWGGECQGLQRYLTSAGIHHRVACPHTHQQNGVAERKHRHIVKIGLTLLAQSSLPQHFWDEAFLSACYLINRLPTKTLENLTPFEKLLNKKPAYIDLKVFGCACWPHLRPYNTTKLSFRSMQCMFLGYRSMHKGYKCLHVLSNRVYISRDVVFDEGQFPFATKPNSSPTPIPKHVLLPILHATVPPDQHVIWTALPIMPHGSNPSQTRLNSLASHVQESAIDHSVPSSPVHCEDVSDQLHDSGPASVPVSSVPDPEQQVASPQSSDVVPDAIQQLPPQASPPSPPRPRTRLQNNIVKTKDFWPRCSAI